MNLIEMINTINDPIHLKLKSETLKNEKENNYNQYSTIFNETSFKRRAVSKIYKYISVNRLN